MMNEEGYTELSFDEEFTTDIQKKFLTLLIHEKEWALLNGLDTIKPEYFTNEYLNLLCKWIKSFYKKYKTPPTALVLKQKAQDLINSKGVAHKEYYRLVEIIDEIFTLDETDTLEHWKEKAVTFSRNAAWKKALYTATGALNITNYEQAIAKFREVLEIGMEKDLGVDYSQHKVDDFMTLLNEDYDPSNMIKTGIEGWDRALGGGFARNNIHFLCAPPGGGKSRAMAFLAKQAMMQRKRIIMITLELSEVETEANINSAITGLTLHDMLKPENREEFIKKRSYFLNTFGGELMIKFFRPGTVNCDTIYNYIRKVMIEKKEALNGIDWKPDFIIVDYMDKLLPIQKVQANSYIDMGAVANDLKNLAISFECPVVTGSQLGKYSWNVTGGAVVSMESIAESAAKVHLAHSMTTINFNPGEKLLSRARLFLAKSRCGSPNSIVWVENNLGKCTLTEIEPWDPVKVDNDAGFSIKSAQVK